MHGVDFLRDLAVIMLTAGVVTVLFHLLKQPVVLGYLVAGIIIGPYTPPFALVHDQERIQTAAELGVVFLMFSLGLEFSLRKLARVGATAFVAAFSEIVLMVGIGDEIGQFFGWKPMDALFLGAILAISSTTIIVKALEELGLKRERFAQLVFGILIVEDILGIAMIALLSGIAISGSVETGQVLVTVGKLSLFLVVALVLGILIVPRLLEFVARFQSNEMLLVTVLGLCFGFCLLVVKLDYSIALGAFVIGAVMAESRHLKAIERLIAPIRDMFSAVFFVSIGLLLDPRVLVDYAGPIALITVAVVLGKIVTCSFGTFLAGNDGRTSMRVGMGLAQIGEFSFIIAQLGLTLKVTSHFLYPIAVAVSAITTFLTPYLIRSADPFTGLLARRVPAPLRRLAELYTQMLTGIAPSGDRVVLARIVRRSLAHVAVNFALVTAIFLGVAHFGSAIDARLGAWIATPHTRNAVLWAAALALSLPFLVAAYRKLKALSMVLAEMGVPGDRLGSYSASARRVVAEVIPAAFVGGVLLFLLALSGSILPPLELLILILVAAAALVLVFRRWFIRVHARLQVALLEPFERPSEPDGH